MLSYAALVLDHDDTVVQSEKTVNYPAVLDMLSKLRPGFTLTREEFTLWCSGEGYTAMCRSYFGLNDAEMELQYQMWKAYVAAHTPPCYDGMGRILRRFRAEGGLICVSSHSATDNILRDYRTHFGLTPDRIYSWDLPVQLRKPSAYSLQDIRERYQLRPSQLLMVDDLRPGCDMARACSVPFACAAWEPRPETVQAYMKSHSDFYLTSVAQLEALLFEPQGPAFV